MTLEFCNRYPLVAWTHVDRRTALFTRLRCGQWSCEYCAKKNQAIWRAFLHSRFDAMGTNWWFVTLTAHSQKRGKMESYHNLTRCIDILVKRMRRVWENFDYVRVFEKHPTSEALHAHLVCYGLSPFLRVVLNRNKTTSYVPEFEREKRAGYWTVKTWLKRQAHASRIGYQTDVQQLEKSYSVHYATKYLTKSAQEIDIKGLRHVQTSRGIGSPNTNAENSWQVGSFITARDFKPGQTVTDIQTGEIIEPEYWSTFDIYPPESN